MTSPVPTDIIQRITDDFGDERASKILANLISRIPDGLPNGTRPRHLRCVIHLAEGDLEKLNHYIEICLRDTRDVMFAAEYRQTGPGFGTKLERIHDFNLPFGESTNHDGSL